MMLRGLATINHSAADRAAAKVGPPSCWAPSSTLNALCSMATSSAPMVLTTAGAGWPGGHRGASAV